MEKINETEFSEVITKQEVIVHNLDELLAQIEYHKAIIANAENGIAECEAKIAQGRDLGVKTTMEVIEQVEVVKELEAEPIAEPAIEPLEEIKAEE